MIGLRCINICLFAVYVRTNATNLAAKWRETLDEVIYSKVFHHSDLMLLVIVALFAALDCSSSKAKKTK